MLFPHRKSKSTFRTFVTTGAHQSHREWAAAHRAAASGWNGYVEFRGVEGQ